ncbi:CTP synthetase [Tabrizicola sp.]|uniref:CTP synthetase n=1 Tax=Tabrizicola sp. TaxID=2005166 RepID=UPI0027327618|nr:CTP synthetase [Tabrizicola sp.]MDP3194353.1 CTP synthetase [Tabrizicola sp.]
MARRLAKPAKEGRSMRLMMVLYSMIATALAGSGVIAVLSAGYDTLWPIVIAAVAGAVLALPASWAVARQID